MSPLTDEILDVQPFAAGSPCQHYIGTAETSLIEVCTTESRDNWAWDQCSCCGATWNYRYVPLVR